jgi:hypothetical protein
MNANYIHPPMSNNGQEMYTVIHLTLELNTVQTDSAGLTAISI